MGTKTALKTLMYPINQNLKWNNPVGRLCFYHQRFGQNARKCVRRCNWHQGN